VWFYRPVIDKIANAKLIFLMKLLAAWIFRPWIRAADPGRRKP